MPHAVQESQYVGGEEKEKKDQITFYGCHNYEMFPFLFVFF